jgi:diaminobutyrate-2-oxoglutarate transaminase
MKDVFERYESEVRTYCRLFPALFERAQGCFLYDVDSRGYLDFFSGAGSLNYGHNHPIIRDKLCEYIAHNGVVQSLDLSTVAKRNFIGEFYDHILTPRKLDSKYKCQFPGPAGSNAIEAALKLARKVSRTKDIIAFDGAFHGVSLGALAVTTDDVSRSVAGVPLQYAIHLPYDTPNITELLDHIMQSRREHEKPAALILETIQAEGGVRPASIRWLHDVQHFVRDTGTLLIVDDIQSGCGRTGAFFSFEETGLEPDIICLSKSLSGYGLPLAMLLIRRELDIWSPGEHSGTFRGFNFAFVTGTAAIQFWKDDSLTKHIASISPLLFARLNALARKYDSVCEEPRGRGLMAGLAFRVSGFGAEVAKCAFKNGLLVEPVGPGKSVLKLMPPLVISETELVLGLQILEDAIDRTVRNGGSSAPA